MYFFLCLSLAFPSHPKTRNKTKNPKSKLQSPDQKKSKRVCPTSVSAHPSAQQLRPQGLKHLNPLLPFILMKKFGCLPHVCSCHQSCGVFFFCGIHWISHHVPKRPPPKKKKTREFPLGALPPCGKTGLAPCRQCFFPRFLHSFFVYFFSFDFYLFIHSMFFLFCLHIHVVFSFCLCRSLGFPSHPKTPKKKSREFPLGGPSPCGKTGLAPCRPCIFSSFFGYFFLI